MAIKNPMILECSSIEKTGSIEEWNYIWEDMGWGMELLLVTEGREAQIKYTQEKRYYGRE